MNVLLDGDPISTVDTAPCSLAQLIEGIRAEHLTSRLVVGVAIDGAPLAQDQLVARLDETLPAGAKVELTSENARSVVCNALEVVAGRLEALSDVHGEIADRLSAGVTREAVEQFAGELGVWHACQGALVECGKLLGDEFHAAAHAESLEAEVRTLAQRLRELKEAFEAGDWMLVADLLRYEMPALSETWCDLLRRLCDRLSAPRA